MQNKENKMATTPMKKLIWQMGLPMIISMVLQALYNVVDSVFVTNIKGIGALANQALTISFPIQILIIAIGVGTGVGLNALLSKNLGEQNKEKVNQIAGTGIVLSLLIYLIFLIFGIFGSHWFISLFAGNNQDVITMGTTYLKICVCFSLGSIAYTVYERFLQATGKTILSTIAQVTGAVANIILDYVFIFPLNMGVAGAAWATIIGQFLSLFMAMYFHYTQNKEINGNLKYLNLDLNLVKGIYHIGASAAIMQAMLAVMMAGMNAILGGTNVNPTVLVGAFGIYYKIQQIALFSAFGLSNTIISILSFNYGMQNKERIDACIKLGIIDSLIVTFIITVLFEIFAGPLTSLFGYSGGTTTEIIGICILAIRIASLGYIFMGLSVAIQGILQSLGYAFKPLLISLLRLVILVFPIAYLFTLTNSVTTLVWWTFPIAEVLTAFIAIILLKQAYNAKIKVIVMPKPSTNLVISISRQHGTNGKAIAEMVAKKLNLACYDKEEIKAFALKNNLVNNNSLEALYDNYLSLDASKEAMINQSLVINKIAQNSPCVIVGRCADYILKDNPHLIKIFLYAGLDYRINKIKTLYNDSSKEALVHINKSDKSRATYYALVANQSWGNPNNYDLCLDCKIGNIKAAEIIACYVNKIR
jgi:multidrug efflux pump